MGSLNRSHIETDGGILLFSGELILLYSDSVDVSIVGGSSFRGRCFLTTHRLVTILNPYRQNAPVRSLCAPFSALKECKVEQPLFGANYIEITVSEEADPNKTFAFKLKFSKGGAIEMAMAMNRVRQRVGQFQQSQPYMAPPPAYTPSPAAQYYQAPPNVYSPGYDSGLQMPVQQFPDQPPIGFIYASTAPPPYPGLANPTASGGQQVPQFPPPGGHQQQPPPPPYNQSGYPSSDHQPAPGPYPTPGAGPYPTPAAAPYPTPAAGPYPTPGAAPPAGSTAYNANYPTPRPAGPSGQAPPPSSGGGYPLPQQQQPPEWSNQPQQPPPSGFSGYPTLPGNSAASQQASSAWPTAPSQNPEWDEKKQG